MKARYYQMSLKGLPGTCIDDIDVECSIYDTDATLLKCISDGMTTFHMKHHRAY